MKKQIFFIVLGVTLLLIPGALWAVNQPGVSQDTPAILVSLGQANAIPLDDAAAAAVRGQAQYVLVKVFGLNMFDYGGNTVKWTWNPLGYRYGNWGGPNYGAGDTLDQMDYFFMVHDGYYSKSYSAGERLQADKGLLYALENQLPKTPYPYWGAIYVSYPNEVPSNVYVYGFSLIGGRIFTKAVEMPYSEYSRREAVYGVQLMIFGKSLLRIN